MKLQRDYFLKEEHFLSPVNCEAWLSAFLSLDFISSHYFFRCLNIFLKQELQSSIFPKCCIYISIKKTSVTIYICSCYIRPYAGNCIFICDSWKPGTANWSIPLSASQKQMWNYNDRYYQEDCERSIAQNWNFVWPLLTSDFCCISDDQIIY